VIDADVRDEEVRGLDVAMDDALARWIARAGGSGPTSETRSPRSTPSSSSIARYTTPSSVAPKSKMRTVLGDLSLLAARASRSKRRMASGSSAAQPFKTFNATFRSSDSCRASHTSPIAPDAMRILSV
jgi:hypothetical protein